jgi:mercuric ion transport protein
VSNLTVLEPFRPILVGLTLLFLGLAFHRLYLRAEVCAPGTQCVDARALTRQRTIFWVVAVPVIGLLAFPWAAPLFY